MGVGECDLFWVGEGECDLFLAGCDWVWVGVGACAVYNYLYLNQI